MISIITCTRSGALPQPLCENIRQTIGCDYEIVAVDNTDNALSIFQAYNRGVEMAKGDVLCFMHDDVAFHTQGWGVKVECHMAKPCVSMIGVVGSHIVPAQGDWRVGYTSEHVLSFVQQIPSFGKQPKYITQQTHEGITGNLTPVATLDGVWFCLSKQMFDNGELHFDEDRFSSFHTYDLDICMQVKKTGGKLFVCDDIILEHFSEGNYSTGFIDSLKIFQKKWEDSLPLIVEGKTNKQQLVSMGPKAERKLMERINRDADVVAIRKYWQAESNGIKPAPLTSKQLEIIEKTEYFHVKAAIKFHPSGDVTKKLLYDYISNPMMHHKSLMLWKYFIYRVLGIKPKYKSFRFPK